MEVPQSVMKSRGSLPRGDDKCFIKKSVLGAAGGINWEIGIDIYTLLYIKDN